LTKKAIKNDFFS